MKEYTYHVELTVKVVADSEDEAYEMVDRSLPYQADLLTLEDVETISKQEKMERWNG